MPPMGSRPRWSGRSISMLRLLVVACFAVAAAASLCRGCFVAACSCSGCRGSGVLRSDLGRMPEAGAHSGDLEGYYVARRLLGGGPGSHPPRCTSKCGSCSPCYPVHVSVPPDVLATTEYYPEAWRCKCHNRLYMP